MANVTAAIKNLFDILTKIDRIESFHLSWHAGWASPSLTIKREHTFNKHVEGPVNWEEGVYETLTHPLAYESCIFFTTGRLGSLDGTIERNTFFIIQEINSAGVAKVRLIHSNAVYWKSVHDIQKCISNGLIQKITVEDLTEEK